METDREYLARMATMFALVLVGIGLIWFICGSEPVVADTKVAESTMTSGNVTNAEYLKIEEAKKKQRDDKIEAVLSVLEILSEIGEALGDAD